ncbi:MAG: GNAT family N-acetyltransferase [Bacteroidetes bacterium]|nr:GNAT family N-acetyltransferase [Bacteroidota bacterium]
MITYRTALSRDAQALLQTRRQAALCNHSEVYSRAVLEAWAPKVDAKTICTESQALNDPDRITLVAETDGKMVGLCTIGVSESLLKQCYVLPEYRGMGIARELVARIESIAKEKGLSSLTLSSSLIALDFYKKQGYHTLHAYEYPLEQGLFISCVMMEKFF